VHRFNNKYGYGNILRRFCWVDDSTPIWGEVQHSLFLNTRYFTADGQLGPPREQLQRFPRLLSWQKLLPFPHQIPIGDPLLYRLPYADIPGKGVPLAGVAPGPFNVFMPKLNDEVDVPTRLTVYAAGAREAVEHSGKTPVYVAVHPRERALQVEVEKALNSIAHVVWAPDDYPGGPTTWSTQLMKQSQTVISDYFGAHVFRSVALFDTSVSLVGDSMLNPAVHPVMNSLLQEFFDAAGDFSTQYDIARKILGVDYERSREELSDILGFTGLKKFLGRPVRVVYQRIRRAKVRSRRF
jgi:hypothetical protein